MVSLRLTIMVFCFRIFARLRSLASTSRTPGLDATFLPSFFDCMRRIRFSAKLRRFLLSARFSVDGNALVIPFLVWCYGRSADDGASCSVFNLETARGSV